MEPHEKGFQTHLGGVYILSNDPNYKDIDEYGFDSRESLFKFIKDNANYDDTILTYTYVPGPRGNPTLQVIQFGDRADFEFELD